MEKEHHRNALFLNITQDDNEIKISATRNGGYTGKDRGFQGLENADFKVLSNEHNITLGEKIKLAWTKCECNFK